MLKNLHPIIQDYRNSSSKIKSQTNTILADVDLNTADDNENKQPGNNHSQRNYKFKQPVQPVTDSPQSNRGFANSSNNRKRRNQPARQPTLKNSIYSSTSSDDEVEDSTIEYYRPQNQWRPSKRNDDSVSTEFILFGSSFVLILCIYILQCLIRNINNYTICFLSRR